ncbi:MAG TPA: hypothetical protein GX708_10005 [Gallicola sp.]|nr:hypothetical protein [Gallicola sp.]
MNFGISIILKKNQLKMSLNFLSQLSLQVQCVDLGDKSSKYNICSGVSYSVREITEIINSNLKKPVRFVFNESDRPNEVNETVGSYYKFNKEFAWTPEITLEKGLIDIIRSHNL